MPLVPPTRDISQEAHKRVRFVTVTQTARHRADVQTRRTSRQLQRQVQYSTQASLSLHLGCTVGPPAIVPDPTHKVDEQLAVVDNRIHASTVRDGIWISTRKAGKHPSITAGWIARLFSAAASTRRPGRASRSCTAIAHLSPLPIDAAQSTDLSPTHSPCF